MKREQIRPDAVKGYKKRLFLLLAVGICCLFYAFYDAIKQQIPDEISMFQGETSVFSYRIPASGTLGSENSGRQIRLNLYEPFSIKAMETGEYMLESRLFGVVHLKHTKVEVSEKRMAVPCGIPVGIYIETEGMLVLATQSLRSENGVCYEPAKNLLKKGDYILRVNGKKITGKEELCRLVLNSGGKEMEILIGRDGKERKVFLTPVMTEEGVYKLGIWIRDDTQGIGTLTYLEGDRFGALGHGISDFDTGTRMDIQGGKLYEADILSVKKGKRGDPGELIGQVDYRDETYLGNIYDNTGSGIYGTLQRKIQEAELLKPVPVGFKQEVKIGEAQLRIRLDDGIRDYKILIEKTDESNKNIKKGMRIRITDERLLRKTGGIVQGMSGSPIIQNGRLVGAVTHVLVNDPTRGYGIFIENMLEEADES